MSTREDAEFRRIVSDDERLGDQIAAGHTLSDREVARTNMRDDTKDAYKSFRDTVAAESERDLEKESTQLAWKMDPGDSYNKRETTEEWIWLMVERELLDLKTKVLNHGYSEDQYLQMLCYWALNFERNKQSSVDFFNPPKEKLEASRRKLDERGGANLIDEQTVVKWLIKDIFGYRNQEKVVKKIHRLINAVNAELDRIDQAEARSNLAAAA